MKVFMAGPSDLHNAYAIVEEYCDEIDAAIRDDLTAFGKYFADDGAFWLAKVEEEIVGCIGMRPLPQVDQACEVKRLYVREHFRGKGIAEQLLKELHCYAKSRMYQWCYLDTKDDLRAAIKFYARHGYEHCDRYNDNPQATIFMRLKL